MEHGVMKLQTPSTKPGPRPKGGESKRSADNFGHCDLFDICDLEFLVTLVLQNSSPSLLAEPSDFDLPQGIRFFRFVCTMTMTTDWSVNISIFD